MVKLFGNSASVFFALLVLALPAREAAAQTADIVANRCAGCVSEVQWQQRAIGAGLGAQYVYDLPTRTLKKYMVTREYEPELRRYNFFASGQTVEPAYATYFVRASNEFQRSGTFEKAIIVDLPTATNTGGHSGDSVFTMFERSGDVTLFGDWLGQYLSNIPLEPSAAEVQDLIRAYPGIRFSSNRMRVTVTVKFKDGRAEFVLSDDEERYEYKEESAKDKDGNTIPSSVTNIRRGPYQYDFPRGEASESYQSFWQLIRRIWRQESRWVCGIVVGGGIGRTCVFTP